MKFKGKISKIDSEGVKAREDNPIIQKKDLGDDLCKYCSLEKKGAYGVDGGYMAGCEGSRCNESYDNYLELWQEAEANRKEYWLSKLYLSQSSNFKSSWLYDDYDLLVNESDRIEGDIKDNQIINIKLL